MQNGHEQRLSTVGAKDDIWWQVSHDTNHHPGSSRLCRLVVGADRIEVGKNQDRTMIGYALDIVATLAITAIGVAGAWLTAKIAKKQELAGIAAATEQVIQAAQITVGELQQTVVDNLKVNGAKLTEAQIAELGELPHFYAPDGLP